MPYEFANYDNWKCDGLNVMGSHHAACTVECEACPVEQCHEIVFTQEEVARYEAFFANHPETRVVTLQKSKSEHTVYCSSCGGEFHREGISTGFSHCCDHAGMKNYDL